MKKHNLWVGLTDIILGLASFAAAFFWAEGTLGSLLCGLGGSLDVYAGVVERAPDFYVDHGLEWFYRLKKEPWRAKRMAALPKFLLTVIGAKITGKEN